MLVFLLIVMIVFTAAYREIRVGVTAEADILKGEGKFRACFFRIPLLKGSFDFDLSKKTIEPKAELKSAVPIPKKKKNLIPNILTVLTLLRINRLGMETHIGSARDSFFGTLAFGSVRILIYSVMSFVKGRFPSAEINTFTVPEYQKDCCFALVSAVVYISLADLVYGLILLLTKRMHRRTIPQPALIGEE